jgi:hypothetical protein
MSLFPDDDKARKATPVFKYFTRYFPKAHREVTKVCVVNNMRYNPDRDPFDINWERSKSPDQLGSAFRHMAESAVDGKVFEAVPPEVAKLTGIEKVYVLAEAMWRIGAELELTIEKQESLDNAWVDANDKPFKQYELPKACPAYWGDHSKYCVLVEGHEGEHLYNL